MGEVHGSTNALRFGLMKMLPIEAGAGLSAAFLGSLRVFGMLGIAAMAAQSSVDIFEDSVIRAPVNNVQINVNNLNKAVTTLGIVARGEAGAYFDAAEQVWERGVYALSISNKAYSGLYNTWEFLERIPGTSDLQDAIRDQLGRLTNLNKDLNSVLFKIASHYDQALDRLDR